jgi:retron-type reverse transcriptase
VLGVPLTDIRGFFDAISHEWLRKFLQHRIGDRRILRLIDKWLQAGVLENGQWKPTEKGTPQGATLSPLLANIYLHYVLDLWIHQWRRKYANGEVIVVRFADDFLVGFQHKEDAERMLTLIRERMAQFALELHSEKTRLIEFGRFAAKMSVNTQSAPPMFEIG